MSVALIRPPVTCIRPASASAIVGAASWLSATAAVTQRHTRTAVVGGSSATRALSVSLCESTVSLLVDRDRDLVAAPERDGPRRVVQPRGGLADGLESDGAPRLEELVGARGDGVGAAVAGEPQDGHRFGGQGDKADSLVVWRWQAVHGPFRGHEEADDPAFLPAQRLGDRCGLKRFGCGWTTMRRWAVRLRYLSDIRTPSATGCVGSRNTPADPFRGLGMSPNCVWRSKYTAV